MKELVGQGKPFYSAVDKAAGLLKRKAGTGAEFMKELMALPGIKQSEITERGLGELLGAPKMTHDQFMQALAAKPAPAIQEKILDVGNTDDPRWLTREERNNPPENLTHHENYTLPGGENYREMLIKMPEAKNYQEPIMEIEAMLRRVDPNDKFQKARLADTLAKLKSANAEQGEQFSGVGAHFGGEPGILASMRLKDRLVPDLEGPHNVTIIGGGGVSNKKFNTREEANAFADVKHQGGYKTKITPLNNKKYLHLEELQSDWHQQGREHGYHEAGEEGKKHNEFEAYSKELAKKYGLNPNQNLAMYATMKGMDPSEVARYEQLQNALIEAKDRVPDAPFKKNWEEMALKRLIHHAAEKGYHGIVVTPGAEQADRYNLANHIDSLHFSRNSDGTVDINAVKDRDTVVDKTMQTPEQIESMVGKELAQKIFNTKTSFGSLEGLDLQVGGEGMKGFYDKKVPNILNAIGKKYGVKTQLHGHRLPGHPSQRGEASERLGLAHVPLAEMTTPQVQAFNQKLDDANAKQLHHFPITEEMRKDVLTNGLPLHKEGGIIHKAVGGQVQPSINQMRMSLMANGKSQFGDIQNIGANEAPGMDVKAYINPDQQRDGIMPVGGVSMGNQPLPMGGVDMSKGQPGQQLSPPGMTPPPQQGQQQPQGGLPSSAGPSSPAQQPPSNILQMTPQGQALNAMTPPQQPAKMAKGGSAKKPAKEIKRVQIDAEGPNGIKGIVVPKHVLEGNKNVGAIGLHEMNEARAQVYGDEHRPPLKLNQIKNIHSQTLNDHFAKPLDEQLAAEEEALGRLRAAKHIGKTANTLDKSEKLDTVRHEFDKQGRTYEGFASKGVAGHALYTTGHGPDTKYQVINTCPGQTVGCGGGKDENGIIDTLRGTCFAPNAESQYAAAAVRRAAHEQAKHDPAMTTDWILAHTGSLREAAENTDSKNKRLLFRPNVVDETDVSSRHVLRHLNKQRRASGLPPIIANSYGKTDELHDPENGYYVTYSNVGPKTKKGQSIEENIARDKQRVNQTILGRNAKGEDFTNEEGNVTPPKGSYMVTDVKRNSPFDKKMQKAIKYAKYWTRGNELSRLTPEEREQPDEAHFGPTGELTTPDKAHYGHVTHDGMRYEYQKQHILHPRMVQVGRNDDGTPHMIPTDSRFMDEDVLNKKVKTRFKTKNGKNAGVILMTTPTESTSNVGHETSFTHHVNEDHLAHAMRNKGEYEIDNPMEQMKSAQKEYIAPQPIKIVRKAEGGVVGHDSEDLMDDDYNAFPERNHAAQHYHAHRHDPHEADEIGYLPFYSHNAHIESAVKNAAHKARKPVTLHKNTDIMRLELMKHNKAK